MKLPFRLILKLVIVAVVLGVSMLIYHRARGKQAGTQEVAQGQEPVKTEAQGYCASKKLKDGAECKYAGATLYYDGNDRVTDVDCFYDCGFEVLPGEFQVVQSVNQQLTTFDNLPFEQQQATLWDKGPLVPAKPNRNNMSMRGFLKAGWSLYVSYSLEENTAELEISTKDIGPFRYELQAGDKVDRVFKIAELFGQELRVASISMTAPSNSGFQLHAIGIVEAERNSKHHASLSPLSFELNEPISDVRIKPKKIRAQQEEKISYSFFSRSPYNFAAADFFSFKPNAKGEVVPTRVHTSDYKNVKAHERTDAREWNGKNRKDQFSFGEHQLQIRAWRGQGTTSEWFGPFYGPRVEVLK